jgi:hypothetical protein
MTKGKRLPICRTCPPSKGSLLADNSGAVRRKLQKQLREMSQGRDKIGKPSIAPEEKLN